MVAKSLKSKNRPGIVGVIGGTAADMDTLSLAEELGARIASLGYILVTGGGPGVMEAASRGANRAGGIVIGILPNERHGMPSAYPNDYVNIPVYTGLSDARNAIIAKTPDVIVAFHGECGTISEAALALKSKTPVISIGCPHCEVLESDPLFVSVRTVSEAMESIKNIIGL